MVNMNRVDSVEKENHNSVENLYNMKFDFFEDPGHGWLKVPLELLDILGIRHLISPYSYQKGEYAYLEEDCDMSVFFKAYRFENDGKDPEIVDHYTDGRARCTTYPRFNNPHYNPEGYKKFLGYI